MRGRRLTLLAAAALALALPAPASAVVNGDAVAEYADYPAQAFVGRNTDGSGPIDEYCTGTLVGSRQILTAARCASYGGGLELPEVGFEIRLGDVDRAEADQYTVAPGGNERHPDYDPDTGAYDIAILTLSEPVELPGFAPVRVVEATENTLWAPGTPARVLGWGERETGFVSQVLRTGDVERLPDANCAGGTFDASLMLCAAGTDQHPCKGDSGSPLLVPEGGFFALAGVFSGAACATPSAPGIFARVGAEPLNSWVHDLTPEADFDFVEARQPQANVRFELISTSRHPEGAGYFTNFRWDLDNDGEFDDRSGKKISLSFASPGEAVVGLEASKPGGDTASIYYAFDVQPDPNAQQPTQTTSTTTTPPAPASTGTRSGPLATILNARRPRVRRGRFPIRIRFAATAPRGVAVIELYRGSRRIGIARTGVRRGATRRVSVKLTPSGRRQLRRDADGRMRVRVRVRVGRRILRSKTLTIRR